MFGRAEYLEPYDTAGGQAFLGVVLAIYAALLIRVQRLANYPRPSRFLTARSSRGGVDASIDRRGPMRPTGMILASSVAVRRATWLIVTGWRQPRPRLVDAMEHLRRQPVDSVAGRTGGER